MIFWDNFKIQNSNNVTVTVTATTVTVGSTTKPALDLGDAVLKADNLFFTHGITLPSGTTFDGPVTLSPGSSFAGAVILPSGSGISGILSSGQLNVSSATITGSLSANRISASSATVSGSLIVTGSASLPSNTSVGGYTWRPGPTQYNLLEIDGHLAAGNDWINVKNLSAQSIQIRIDLYNDYSAQDGYYSEYRIDGSPVWGQSTTLIKPGQSYSLDFRDPDDQFLANNGYIRVRYSLSSTVSDSTQWQDINGSPIRPTDIQGDPKAQRTFGNGEGLAEWFRSVLYENESGTEYWCVFSIANPTNSTTVLSASFHNMLQRMSQLGYTHVALCGTEYNVAWQAISAIPSTLYYIGGVIGFLKVSNS